MYYAVKRILLQCYVWSFYVVPRTTYVFRCSFPWCRISSARELLQADVLGPRVLLWGGVWRLPNLVFWVVLKILSKQLLLRRHKWLGDQWHHKPSNHQTPEQRVTKKPMPKGYQKQSFLRQPVPKNRWDGAQTAKSLSKDPLEICRKLQALATYVDKDRPSGRLAGWPRKTQICTWFCLRWFFHYFGPY